MELLTCLAIETRPMCKKKEREECVLKIQSVRGVKVQRCATLLMKYIKTSNQKGKKRRKTMGKKIIVVYRCHKQNYAPKHEHCL